MGEAAATPEVVRALRERLEDGDPKVRTSATWALGEMGPAAATLEVVGALVERFRDEDGDVAGASAFYLGMMASGRPEVVRALVPHLRDASAEVRRNALSALQWTGSATRWPPEVLDVLAECLRDGDAGVRFRALDVLMEVSELGPVPATPGILRGLRERLGDEKAMIRQAAALLLGRMGGAAARPEVLRALRWRLGDADPEVREAADWALRSIGRAAGRSVRPDRRRPGGGRRKH